MSKDDAADRTSTPATRLNPKAEQPKPDDPDATPMDDIDVPGVPSLSELEGEIGEFTGPRAGH